MGRRFATIDIGTNTVLLLAAEARGGHFHSLAERAEITRLGRGVDRAGRLSPEGLAETLAAVASFAALARELGCEHVAATATSAARDAANGSELLEGARALGVEIEIIPGEREAELSWRAVTRDFARPGVPLAVVDIGGGSTELVLGSNGEANWRRSFDVGSVRLTERHLAADDPPTPAALAALDRRLDETLARVPRLPAGGRAVGIAGTFTTLAAVHLALEPYDAAVVHGLELTRDQLEAVGLRLAALPLDARRRVPGLAPKRADVIVAGARLAAATLRALGAERVTIGDRGLRWGHLYERFGSALNAG